MLQHEYVTLKFATTYLCLVIRGRTLLLLIGVWLSFTF